MAAELAMAKSVDSDTRKRVLKVCETQGQVEVMLARFGIDSSHSFTPGTVRQGLVLLTEFRLMTFKKTPFVGLKLKLNLPLLDMGEVSVGARGRSHLVTLLTFRSGVEKSMRLALVAQMSLTRELVHTLMKTTYLMHYGKPVRDQPQYYLPAEISNGFVTPDVGPRAQEAMLLTYRAVADLLRRPQQLAVIEYIRRSCQMDESPVLDPVQAFEGNLKPDNDDAQALALAARYTGAFVGIRAVNLPHLGCQGVESLLHALGPHSPINLLELCDVGMCGRSATALGIALGNLGDSGANLPALKSLILYKSTLSDSSIRSIVRGLRQCQARLSTLVLAHCGLSRASVTLVCRELMCVEPLRDCVGFVNLSGGTAGPSGSKAVEEFLACASACQHFVAVRCQLETKTIINGLLRNDSLALSTLQGINLSCNKVGLRAASSLGKVLQQTSSLRDIVLSDTRLSPEGMVALLRGALANNKLPGGFRLDFSHNEINSNVLLQLFQEVSAANPQQLSRINALDFSDTRMSLEQMAKTAEAAALLTALETLAICNNAKTGFFRKGDLLGEQLVNLVKTSSTLKHLFISGESNASALGIALTPLAESLARCRTLETLSVGGNALPHRTIQSLSKSLLTNRSLRALELDHNHIGWTDLQELVSAVLVNDGLCFLDIENELQRHVRKRPLETSKMQEQLQQRLRTNCIRQQVELTDVIPKQPLPSLVQHRRSYTSLRRKGNSSTPSRRFGTTEMDPISASFPRRPQFGVPLDKCDAVAVPGYLASIPRVLLQMQKFIYENAIDSEGVFRLAPDASEARVIKALLDRGEPVSEWNDINCVPNALKAFFRELTPPLLTQEVLRSAQEEGALEALMQALGEPQRSVFQWLLDLCARVSSRERSNKMSAENLSIVFAPNLVEVGAGEDPLQSIRQSQEVAKLLEMGIKGRSGNTGLSLEQIDEALQQQQQSGESRFSAASDFDADEYPSSVSYDSTNGSMPSILDNSQVFSYLSEPQAFKVANSSSRKASTPRRLSLPGRHSAGSEPRHLHHDLEPTMMHAEDFALVYSSNQNVPPSVVRQARSDRAVTTMTRKGAMSKSLSPRSRLQAASTSVYSADFKRELAERLLRRFERGPNATT